MAKSFIHERRNVAIIHCGILNEGHQSLISEHDWNIIPIKNWAVIKSMDYELIVLDEAQRIYPSQLEQIETYVNQERINCILCHDEMQCLRDWESSNNISQIIKKLVGALDFSLSDKIRTNKEIATFIYALFDKKYDVSQSYGNNIQINYYTSIRFAKKQMELMSLEGWKIINLTPSKRDVHPYDDYCIQSADNSHKVIGQEFDRVIAVIDSHFYYRGDKLEFRDYKIAPYYNPTKMLFQNMTRTRKELYVFVINNDEIMRRCLYILDPIVYQSFK